MELDPDWSEELMILESSVDASRANQDIAMLEKLFRREKELLQCVERFTDKLYSEALSPTENYASLEVVGERNLSNADSEPFTLNELNAEQADAKSAHGFADYSDGSPDEALSLAFFQESAKDEGAYLQLDDRDYVDLLLENEGVILIDSQLSVDGGIIDCNDELDGDATVEYQVDAILAEYLAAADFSTDATDDPKIRSQARVLLERLPEPVAKANDTAEASTAPKIELKGRKISPRRYCHKCQKFDVDESKISVPKRCRDCGNLLIYRCTKCKEKYYIYYTSLFSHSKTCKSKKASTGVPTSLVLYGCQDCYFKSLHVDSIVKHLRKTRHKFRAADGDSSVEPRDRAKYTKRFVEDCAQAFKRFCAKCSEVVASDGDDAGDDERTCDKCDARLAYRCVKCGRTSRGYKSLVYHLETNCLTKTYACRDCDFVTARWKFIRRHLAKQRLNVSCHYRDTPTRVNNTRARSSARRNAAQSLQCQFCDWYTTNVAARLDKHILRNHSENNDSAKTLQCAICRRYSTKNRHDFWKHIERRHREK
ncbi:zinc finger protein 485-like [Phymastichus coffea]|uniref:zinc finger protein 485-like n=1 Tax=Phymastichus coffea TaxID=108790 RepID=UPI00273C2022|nr:zinc finger protein 485-like [Phymastichus coffea]